MKQAMAAYDDARVGTGRAEADLTNPGALKAACWRSTPWTRIQASEATSPASSCSRDFRFPGAIICSNPASNQNGNTTVVLRGQLKDASGDFGTQLDVNNIPQGLASGVDLQVTS